MKSDINMSKLSIDCLQHFVGTSFPACFFSHLDFSLQEEPSSVMFFLGRWCHLRPWRFSKPDSTAPPQSNWSSCFEEDTGLETSWGAFQLEVSYDPIPNLTCSYFFKGQILSNHYRKSLSEVLPTYSLGISAQTW